MGICKVKSHHSVIISITTIVSRHNRPIITAKCDFMTRISYHSHPQAAHCVLRKAVKGVDSIKELNTKSTLVLPLTRLEQRLPLAGGEDKLC
jgi:hypothetical protein